MATFITQRDAAITAYQTLIYPNNVGAIDGQVHQDSGVGQLESVYQNLVGYDNYSYVIVRTGVDSTGAENNTFLQNGQNLVDAYNAAKLLTPNGGALSATNRVAVLVPPGRYDLGANFINANTEYVDLISLGDSPEDVVINGVLMPGTFVQNANDMVIKGVTLKYSGPNPAGVAYLPASGNSYSNTKMENVILDGSGASNVTPNNDNILEYNGTYKNVKATNYTGNAWDDNCNGVFIGCTCDGPGFAASSFLSGANMTDCSATEGFGADCSGTFIRCKTTSGTGFGTGANCSGYFEDCSVATEGFGFADTSGTYKNCTATGAAFGYGFGFTFSVSGSYINCRAGEKSFGYGNGPRTAYYEGCTGGNESFNSSFGSASSSTYVNCTAGDFSFYFGDSSSVYINCIAGNSSFVSMHGRAEGCASGDNSFTSDSATSVFVDCKGGDNCFTGKLDGQYTNCTAKERSFTGWIFGNSISHSGSLHSCQAGDYSFFSFNGSNGLSTAILFAGTMKDCIGGNSSFGGCVNTGAVPVTLSMDGLIDSCVGGDDSFYSPIDGPSASSINKTIMNCKGGEASFAGNGGNITSTGALINCHLVDSSNRLGSSAWRGVMAGRMENCIWIITGAAQDCLVVDDGAKLYGCTFVSGAGGTSIVPATLTANIAMAHCRTNNALGAGVTNVVGTGYNVVDAAI